VERRPGKYFGAGTALRQISLATAGTLTLKLSGKSPRSVYFPAQIAPPNAVFGIKNLKKKLGGDPLPHPPSLGPRSRKPFLQIKIYHYTSSTNRSATQQLMVVPPTSANHCWTPSIRCARPRGLELLAGRPPRTAGL